MSDSYLHAPIAYSDSLSMIKNVVENKKKCEGQVTENKEASFQLGES